MNDQIQKVGFVGLGAMGGGMALNLHRAGFAVTGCDLNPEARQRLAAVGATTTADLNDLLDGSYDLLSFCLAYKDMVKLTETVLLERVPPGSTIVDHGTLSAPATRRLHEDFKSRDVDYFEVTISGGKGLAESGELFLFVGGTEEARGTFRPYLAAVGNPQTTYYAGEPGQAQVMKAVQNMASWYLDGIRMEVMAFGLHSGLSWDQILQACKEDKQPGRFARMARFMQEKNPAHMANLNAEYDYFLEECDASGFPMPAMRGLMNYLHREERDTTDVVHRPAHNMWKRFMRDGANKTGITVE